MSFLNNYDGSSNFWKVNPQLLIPQEFEDLYSKDKSKGKEESSKVMYAICFLLDPSDDNKFKNIPEPDRRDLIAKDYLKDPKFKWDKYNSLIEFCKANFILTQAERSLYNMEKELHNRDLFLAEWTWDKEDGEKKDKMLANTQKLYADLNRVKEMVKQEEVKSKDKGGSKPTASDTGSM
jgi:hypothetical protein